MHEFLDLPPFDYDFENVAYDAPAFDAALGLEGMHRVRPKVAPQPRRTILPPDLFKRFSGMDFWRSLNDSRAFRIVAGPETPVNSEHPLSPTNFASKPQA